MRSIEENGSSVYGSAEEVSSSNGANFEFQKANRVTRGNRHRMALGKPAPSKWDDAQKWLVGFSRGGERTDVNAKPRNSNADDRRLISDVPQKEKEFSCSSDDEGMGNGGTRPPTMMQDEGDTKDMDSNQAIWRINKLSKNSGSVAAIQSICVRDMGTDMTPITSQEPSRTGTPLRDTTPMARSPISSRTSSPGRGEQGVQSLESYQTGIESFENRTLFFGREGGVVRWPTQEDEESNACKVSETKNLEQARKSNPLEVRAMAWDEAERAKYTARCKREEVKIQAWENHQKRKAEMEMRRMEAKAERMKSRAQEKLANKLAATRRIAEEKRANAEAKLNEQAARTSEKADYMRRTGHLPSSFSFFKLPSICW